MRQRTHGVWLLAFLLLNLQAQSKTSLATHAVDENNLEIDLSIPLEAGQYLYADYIQITVNNPAVQLSHWKSSVTPVIEYDTIFKENRNIIKQSPTLHLKATKEPTAEMSPAYLRLIYYTNKSKSAQETLWPLNFISANPVIAATEQPELKPDAPKAPLANETQPAKVAEKSISWLESLKNLATRSQLLWVRLLIAFLLGLLLSLTPCIYPMIPITIGILQAQGSSSFARNFSLALAYTMGIATTFALFGLAAALAGHAFGSFMNNPIVILVIIALLIYSALSLFGFYEIKMPRLFKNQSTSKGGSFIAAFLFGAASGTVASPCLSPGLFFMLTLVATLKSIWSGFILLFTFAVGLSIPLLLVGTFSGSLNLLPRAGSWMLEIKYLLGFMLLGMCFYFLTNILPLPLLLVLFAIFLFIAGIFYLYHAKKLGGSSWKAISNLLGMLLLASSAFIAVKAFQATYIPAVIQKTSESWLSDYTAALNQARTSSKPLFIFVHAPRCSACNEIEEKLKETRPLAAMAHVVALQIDLSKDSDSSTKAVVETFDILGAPVCILFNPKDSNVISRWDGELDQEQFENMIKTIEKY